MIRLRTVFFLVALVAGLAFTAEAAIDNTAHDTSVGSQGSCSACHIPHKSVGKRLWPADMSARETSYGEVGALCYYCHGVGGGANLAAAVQNNIMDATQGAFSHGLTKANIPGGGNGLTGATDLPYTQAAAGTAIQCTSCHNVHDDTNRPFLRRPMETLCQDCHTGRSFVGGAASSGPTATFGNWGSGFVGATNPGSHPVGADITGNNFGGASPINFNLSLFINMARSATVGGWSIGGHLSSGATPAVMCGSCHAPHGVDTDEATPSAELYPARNILVFTQHTGTGAEATVANGAGDANNHLCESCHYTTATTIDASTNVAYVPTTWNVSGGTQPQGGTAQGTNYNKQPNPGGTAYTHPVDDLGAQYAAGVSAFPTDWPSGSTPGTNVSPGPICESCHTPHPSANAGRATITVSSGTPILRDSPTALCGRCHTTTMAKHHPVGTGLITARFTKLSTTGGYIGDSASTNLTCGDCHNGLSGAAHNWASRSQVALDNDWVPANNNRSSDAVGDASLPNTAAGDSCKQCHMRTSEATGRHQSPTNNSGDAGGAVTHTWRSNPGYTDLGEGSHFLGVPDNAAMYANGYFNGATIDLRTNAWPNVSTTNGKAAGGWSRWYGAQGNVGCQSCHELQPTRNVDNTALLLAWFKDGDTEANDPANDPSSFCQGCHGQTPGGGNPHPMTGATISRAATAGRSPTTLITTPIYDPVTQPNGAYIGTGAPTRTPTGGVAGTSTFPATNSVNCDSCHQPHDANGNGGTYIYEAPGANVSATTAPVLNPTTLNPGRGSTAVGIQDMNFCNQCHIY